jgi:hypothetical protein
VRDSPDGSDTHYARWSASGAGSTSAPALSTTSSTSRSCGLLLSAGAVWTLLRQEQRRCLYCSKWLQVPQPRSVRVA